MLAEIGNYFWDLAEHWAAFMTGGIPAALILIVERIRGKQLPLRAFAFFVAFGFLAAAYQAHKQLSDDLTSAKSSNQSLKSDLNAANDQIAETRRQLAAALKWIPLASLPPSVGSHGNVLKNIYIENGDTGIRFDGPASDNTLEGIETKNVKHGIDIGVGDKKK